IPKTGKYEVRLAYSPGTNRAARVPVTVFSADGEKTLYIDQRKTPNIDGLFVSLGQHTFERTGQGFVIIANEGTTGPVIADCVQSSPVKKLVERNREGERRGGKPAADEAGKLRKLEQELKALAARGPRRDMVMSVVEGTRIEDTRVHVRGSVHNLGEKAVRG